MVPFLPKSKGGSLARTWSDHQAGLTRVEFLVFLAILASTLSMVVLSKVPLPTLLALLPTPRNELERTGLYGELSIPLQPPVEMDGLSRSEIFALREQAVSRMVPALVTKYSTPADIFQIEGGRPWWGIEGLYYFGPGDRSIEGPAEETRTFLNPFLLIAAVDNAAISSSATVDGSTVYPLPTSLSLDLSRHSGHVHYDMSGYARHLSRVDTDNTGRFSGGMGIGLTTYNAQDFGFEVAQFDTEASANIGRVTDTMFRLIQFIHVGRSCGYPGGCNNMSPYQAETDLVVRKLPARLVCKLWKKMPGSQTQKPDFTFQLDFD